MERGDLMYTITSSEITIETVSGFSLHFVVTGEEYRLICWLGHLEGKTGYREDKVDEYKRVIAESKEKIAPVNAMMERDGSETYLTLGQKVPCTSAEGLVEDFDVNIKRFEEACITVLNLLEGKRKVDETDIPF